MLTLGKDILGFSLLAKDGEIGKVKDIFFDDKTWHVRYIVVDTGNWLVEKKVLIAPEALQSPRYKSEEIPVNLTKKQVENSPDVDEDKPISRQKEAELFNYYDWLPYWQVTAGPDTLNTLPPVVPSDAHKDKAALHPGNPNLRSLLEVSGYSILSLNDDSGHVKDFLLDDQSWQLKYLEVDTRDWIPGKKALVPIQWLEEIDWASNEVHLNLKKETLEHCPDVDLENPVDPHTEEELLVYYESSEY